MNNVHVVSNCATQALSRTLSMLCPDAQVSCTEYEAAMADKDNLRTKIKAADTLVLLPKARRLIENMIGVRVLKGKQLIEVPGFYFSGYHPDTCYVRSSKGYPVNTRFGVYHSVICLSAFLHGLSAAETVRLYNTQTYAALDYFGEWDRQRSLLLTSFAEADLDISGPFLRWSRRGCFMHSVNHPHIDCLSDVARLVASKLNTRVLDFRSPPDDYLAVNAIYPCYPEIAENCGAHGDTLFKLSKQDKVVDLATFVDMSFFTYTRHGAADLNFAPEYQAKVAAMTAVLTGSPVQGTAA